MRLSHRFAPVIAALVLPVALPDDAASHTPHSPETGLRARVADERPFGASCRTRVLGSEVTAWCHNPYPETDRVSLHVECDRWWDIDSDGAPVGAGPAETVRLTGRCWKEIRSAWVSHER